MREKELAAKLLCAAGVTPGMKSDLLTAVALLSANSIPARLATPSEVAQRRAKLLRPPARDRWGGSDSGTQPRMRPDVGTPVPAVTSTCSTSGTWFTEVPLS